MVQINKSAAQSAAAKRKDLTKRQKHNTHAQSAASKRQDLTEAVVIRASANMQRAKLQCTCRTNNLIILISLVV